MGGPGSGNWYRSGSRDTVESSRAIDVRRWKRDGWLVPGQRLVTSWSRDGETTASIRVHVGHGDVTLNYRWRQYGDDWAEVEQRVPLTWTPCHLGGERPWFVCDVYRNGVYCGRRVAKLYGAGKLFACRHCYDLAYQTQHEKFDGRMTLKAQKIRVKLGGSASLAEPFPDKPKGMHWKTYERLYREAEQAETLSWAAAAQRFGILL